jgi:hypothetical protein
LIAFMLGRLEITVDECIRQYLLLMEEVFTGCTWWNYAWDGQFYDAGKLENVVKHLVKTELGNEDAPLFQGNEKCKVYVPSSSLQKEYIKKDHKRNQLDVQKICTYFVFRPQICHRDVGRGRQQPRASNPSFVYQQERDIGAPRNQTLAGGARDVGRAVPFQAPDRRQRHACRRRARRQQPGGMVS